MTGCFHTSCEPEKANCCFLNWKGSFGTLQFIFDLKSKADRWSIKPEFMSESNYFTCVFKRTQLSFFILIITFLKTWFWSFLASFRLKLIDCDVFMGCVILKGWEYSTFSRKIDQIVKRNKVKWFPAGGRFFFWRGLVAIKIQQSALNQLHKVAFRTYT